MNPKPLSLKLAVLTVLLPFLTPASAAADDLVATSPVQMTPGDLGMLLDSNFKPLVGTDNRVHRGPVQMRDGPGETRAVWLRQRVKEMLRASGNAWYGVASAETETGTTASSSYGFYRAYQTETVYSLEPGTFRTTPVPENAEWYVSQIHVGRMYEVLCQGSSAALSTAASMGATGLFAGGKGSFQVEGEASSLSCSFRLLGLRPRAGQSGDALFLSSATDVEATYEAEGDVRPVLVQYSRVPRELRESAALNSTLAVRLLRVELPKTQPGGDAWDGFGGNPELSIWAKVDGEVVYRSDIYDDQYIVEPRSIVVKGLSRDEGKVVRFTVLEVDPGGGDSGGAVEIDWRQVGPIPAAGLTLDLLTDRGTKIRIGLEPE